MSKYDIRLYFSLRENKIRVFLLFSFLILFITQIFSGIRELDDFLVIVVFALFINDFIYKFKNPNFKEKVLQTERQKSIRKKINFLILFIFCLPIVLDLFQMNQVGQNLIYKIVLILWAQAFLVDAFLHYKETNSKKWLIFTQTAAMLIIFMAFA